MEVLETPANALKDERAKTTSENSEARDSSFDTSLSISVSDTDSEILEAFSRKDLKTENHRLSSHETDNLVEELYLTQDALHDLEDSKENLRPIRKPQENGTYHAVPFHIPEEVSDKTKKSSSVCQNINIHDTYTKEEMIKNCMPSKNWVQKNYVVNMDGSGENINNHYYVNQNDLKSKIQRIQISEEVTQVKEVQVVVAIDLGTTYSGYAFSYINHHFDKEIHMMRKWEGGDPGLINQKIPTTLLVSPDGQFHSFGFGARDFYHDLDPGEASEWFFFDKFKKTLHNNPDVNYETKILAANGKSFPVVEILSMAIRYLSELALVELSDHGNEFNQDGIQWVITVPAIWGHNAKQLMRQAACKAGICLDDRPEALIIALEPEAAAVWCKNLRLDQIDGKKITKEHYQHSTQGTCFIIADCGGGTVDVTVHKLHYPKGPLRELYKATGEPCGSLGIDEEFDRLLGQIFGFPFMTKLRCQRPAAYNELMLSFESKKRSILPFRVASLNVSLPFAFIDFYQSTSGKKVEDTVKQYGRPELSWSVQGMLKISPQLMSELFQPTVDSIVKHVEGVLMDPEVKESAKYLFLVGGFAESVLLQEAFRKMLNNLNMHPPIIPQGASLCVLKGAVLYGANPEVVSMRKSQHTYGIGVLKPFKRGSHPPEKLVMRDNREWCADVFDTLVTINQNLYSGESVLRRYTPTNPSQNEIILHIYCTDVSNPQFVTDEGVKRIGTLKLKLTSELGRDKPREILTRLIFSSTELTVSAMDLETANYTDTSLTFIS